jgi:CHASE2 domain-containing sensor protein
MVFVKPFRVFDEFAYDSVLLLCKHAAPSNASDSVVIVGIDAAGESKVGAWPWKRGVLARLIDTINSCSPRVIAVDILFPHAEENAAQSDSLSAALCKVKKLVLPFHASGLKGEGEIQALAVNDRIYSQRFLTLSDSAKIKDLTLFSASRIDASDPVFTACADRSGVNNVTTSGAGKKLREIVQVIRAGNDYYPSFSLSCVAAYLNSTPQEFILDGSGSVTVGNKTVGISPFAAATLVNFRGQAGTIRTVSAAQLISGHKNCSMLRDKLIFLGVTDTSADADFFSTSAGMRFPGVELWATGALDVLQNAWIRESDPIADACNKALVFIMFPGLILIAGGRKKTLTIGLASACAVASLLLSCLLIRSSLYFWDPVGHWYAWLIVILWPAMQRSVLVSRGKKPR